MEFKKKNREEISRLVSDRQAYISSLELKLEKFTQNTSSYLDIKEKLEKLSASLSAAEEKIQGLSWLMKSQNDNHQQQIRALTSRYEELQTGFSTFTYASAQRGQILPAPSGSLQVPGQVIKDLQEFICLNSAQVKNEIEQRIEILNSKQVVFCKSIENRVDSVQSLESRVKEEIEVNMMKIAEKSAELQREVSSKLESIVSLNSERYKELSHKVSMSSSNVLSEDLSAVRQKLGKIEDLHKVWQDNEVKRELEVREASQAAWTVENQLKQLEKQVSGFSSRLSSLSEYPDSHFVAGIDSKVNHLAGSLKKYVSLQKILHSKVESLEDTVKHLSHKRFKEQQARKTPDSDRSLSVSKTSNLKPSPTPRNKTPKVKNESRSRIDILYDELTKIVN